MPTSIFQESLISEQKLHFINAHLEAFEVESLYPLEIFQDFVAKNNGISSIEASCKVEADKLLAGRFLVFVPQPKLEERLAQTLNFFRQVESRVDVKINYDLLEQFLGKSFDFSKIVKITTGIDLRENLADSSLKIHFRLDDYPEKIETALALDGNNSAALRWIALQTVPLIGFDFYLDGRSEIELYCELTEEQFQQPNIENFLKQTFPALVLKPLQVSNFFYVGLSKDNADPVLYYNLKGKKDLLSYFSINDTAQRVHAFYQHQAVLPEMWVGVAQRELENSRIENIRLYYYKSFDFNS
ncbi:LynF/TruF/PatF family peptide O-prenyltransferase [Nostoc sp. UHCC 0702]|nr:LynF/TruF/PatF family peptide O-prenyltransferase [Nostoc sp. UHCC 0702]